jgi:hypothetical protein
MKAFLTLLYQVFFVVSPIVPVFLQCIGLLFKVLGVQFFSSHLSDREAKGLD